MSTFQQKGEKSGPVFHSVSTHVSTSAGRATAAATSISPASGRGAPHLRRRAGAGSHHGGRGAAHAPDRTGQARGGAHGSAASRSATHAHAAGSQIGHLGDVVLVDGRALHGHGHDVLAPEQDEAEDALLLALRRLGRLGLELPELLAISQDEVHVLVERLEGANEGARVLQDDPHAVVDVAAHLVAPAHHHLDGFAEKNNIVQF